MQILMWEVWAAAFSHSQLPTLRSKDRGKDMHNHDNQTEHSPLRLLVGTKGETRGTTVPTFARSPPLA